MTSSAKSTKDVAVSFTTGLHYEYYYGYVKITSYFSTTVEVRRAT